MTPPPVSRQEALELRTVWVRNRSMLCVYALGMTPHDAWRVADEDYRAELPHRTRPQP